MLLPLDVSVPWLLAKQTVDNQKGVSQAFQWEAVGKPLSQVSFIPALPWLLHT